MIDNDLEFLISVGNEICEGCGEKRDCGLEYEDCSRIFKARVFLETYKIIEEEE